MFWRVQDEANLNRYILWNLWRFIPIKKSQWSQHDENCNSHCCHICTSQHVEIDTWFFRIGTNVYSDEMSRWKTWISETFAFQPGYCYCSLHFPIVFSSTFAFHPIFWVMKIKTKFGYLNAINHFRRGQRLPGVSDGLRNLSHWDNRIWGSPPWRLLGPLEW